jgi:hypothetical protein
MPNWMTIVWLAGGIVAWFLLMKIVLPRAGVPT